MSKLIDSDGEIRNNWYIVCLTNELAKKPIQRTIYDQSIVVFRTSNGISAQVDRCLHRGTKLSEGEVTGDCVKCPYHGWEYSNDGFVEHVPSEGPTRERKKHFKNEIYQCIEQDGVIWVWMGDQEALTPPPWRFPKIDDKKWIHYFMITDFDNDVTNLVENFMDVPHTVYVHKNWFRNKTFTRVPFQVKVNGGKVLATYNQKDDEIGVLTKVILNPAKKPMFHTDEFVYPNLTNVTYMFGEKYGFVINSQITPISEYKSRVYTYISYRITLGGNLLKSFIQFYTRKVIEQDVDIMINQGSNLQIFPDHKFYSTDADEIHIGIERLRKLGVTDQEKVFEQDYTKEKDFWI